MSNKQLTVLNLVLLAVMCTIFILSRLLKPTVEEPIKMVTWQRVQFPILIECPADNRFDGNISAFVHVSDGTISGLWAISATSKIPGNVITNNALRTKGLVCAQILPEEVEIDLSVFEQEQQ